MEGYWHFSHHHPFSFHQRIEGAKITCNGCKFPCTNSAVYSCSACQVFLHDRCIRAERSLIHPLHPQHPLTLLPYPTYKARRFGCSFCKNPGSGFCYSCATCDFDLHIHCAYHSLNPKLKHIKIKSHPHPLKLLILKQASITCNVCGTFCHPNTEFYRCGTCDYNAHVECTSLPDTVRRKDHAHPLRLLYVNPYSAFQCDVCEDEIKKENCMYLCSSGNCIYGVHVKCASALVLEKAPLGETFFLQGLERMLAKASIDG